MLRVPWRRKASRSSSSGDGIAGSGAGDGATGGVDWVRVSVCWPPRILGRAAWRALSSASCTAGDSGGVGRAADDGDDALGFGIVRGALAGCGRGA